MTTKKIKTSDILGSSYYTYELSSSNYTPALNGTITITCTCKDVYGDNVGSKSLTLYQNGTSKGSQTTNSNGVATWSITCSTAGLQKFNIEDTSIEVFVDNKEDKTNKVTSLSENSTDTQYPTAKAVYENIQSNKNVWYGTCSSSGSAQVKEVDVSNWSFNTGNILFVKFSYGNSYDGNVELKIGNVSTRIRIRTASDESVRYHWVVGETVCFAYDGTSFVMVNEGMASTTYYGITKLENSVSSTSTTTSATPNSVKQAYDLANSRENPSNKVSSWSSPTTDSHYPSEKLTKDTLDTKLSFSELVSYYDKYTDELVITKGYTITNATELANAIANISDGETLYLKNGTYTLSEAFSLPNCTIYGENATIKEIGLTFEENGNSNINISGITFDGNNVQNMRPFIVIQTITDVHIHNCTFTNKRADWNGDNIFVYQSDANHSIEIDHCTFTGDNYCNGYGHTKASIVYDGGQGYSTAYNISIHHNTFNHNENVGDSNNLYNGRAICFMSATLNNSVAYCNTYVGSGDTNNGITESQCTD